MDCKEQRRKFYNDVLANGWAGVDSLPMGYMPEVEQELKVKWFARLARKHKPKLNQQPRLLNHFTLGADPEFVLFDAARGSLLPGSQLGLRTGQAYGVDSNGRLIEVRPKPSRWALEVLASCLVSMRWFALTSGTVRAHEWRAGAFLLRDGLGGHIHFARKTARRVEEVKALDCATDLLASIGVFPVSEMNQRKAGDQFNQRYGLPGDIRMQAHGYEYRTMPSWLDSPWQAYLSLTVAKLMAHDPDVFSKLPSGQSVKSAQVRVANLLAKWQGLDDDAALALHTLRAVGWPKHQGGDFKARWGLRYNEDATAQITLVPKMIQPDADEIKELFCHFLNNSPLMPTVPKAYWRSELPKGYVEILSYTETQRTVGVGELLAELVVSTKLQMSFGTTEDSPIDMRFSSAMHDALPAGSIKKLQDEYGLTTMIEPGKEVMVIRLSRQARSSTRLRGIREALLSGIFPIWEAATVTDSSFSDWFKARGAKTEHKVVSKELSRKEG